MIFVRSYRRLILNLFKFWFNFYVIDNEWILFQDNDLYFLFLNWILSTNFFLYRSVFNTDFWFNFTQCRCLYFATTYPRFNLFIIWCRTCLLCCSKCLKRPLNLTKTFFSIYCDKILFVKDLPRKNLFVLRAQPNCLKRTKIRTLRLIYNLSIRLNWYRNISN